MTFVYYNIVVHHFKTQHSTSIKHIYHFRHAYNPTWDLNLVNSVCCHHTHTHHTPHTRVHEPGRERGNGQKDGTLMVWYGMVWLWYSCNGGREKRSKKKKAKRSVESVKAFDQGKMSKLIHVPPYTQSISLKWHSPHSPPPLFTVSLCHSLVRLAIKRKRHFWLAFLLVCVCTVCEEE